MKGIIGFSYEDWTPICFLFEELFENQPEADLEGFKREFTLPREFRGRRAASPVYLRAGIQEGGVWGYGRAGFVNGPMLFPEAWHHFDHELRSSWFVDPSELVDEG